MTRASSGQEDVERQGEHQTARRAAAVHQGTYQPGGRRVAGDPWEVELLIFEHVFLDFVCLCFLCDYLVYLMLTDGKNNEIEQCVEVAKSTRKNGYFCHFCHFGTN